MAATHREPQISADQATLPQGHLLDRMRMPLLGGGAVLLLASLVWGFSGASQQFWFSYLTALLFYFSIGLGCLFFVLVSFASRAGWSVAVRRIAEHVSMTLPIMCLLALPFLFLGLHDLYHWTHAEAVAKDELLQAKQGYLNTGFFLIRSFIYLAAWTLLAWWFRRESMRQDEVGDPHITRVLQSRSAPALIVFALTVTFAAFDWIMSLDPHWYSTIFGVYFFAGSFLSALAFMTILILRLQKTGVLKGVVNYEHFHDLGKLTFGFVVFWAYIAFSQFMLIWYGNIPEETLWFTHRLEHGWYPISILLCIGHFVVPFFFLLPVSIKRSSTTLTLAGVWLLVFHYIDLYWLVMPTRLGPDGELVGFHPHLLDLLCWVGMGAVFLGAVAWALRSPSLVAIKDPRLGESMSYENV